MTLEVATYIQDLNENYPEDSSDANELDDHIRLIKTVLGNSFPGDGASDPMDAALTVTRAQIESWDARVTALEAIPAPAQTSAKIGQVSVTGTGTINVTGIGFEPSAVLCFSTGTKVGETVISMACFDRQSDFANTVTMGNDYNGTPFSRSTSYQSFAAALLNSSGASEVVTISATNSDGFDLFVNAYTNGMQFIYVAIP